MCCYICIAHNQQGNAKKKGQVYEIYWYRYICILNICADTYIYMYMYLYFDFYSFLWPSDWRCKNNIYNSLFSSKLNIWRGGGEWEKKNAFLSVLDG